MEKVVIYGVSNTMQYCRSWARAALSRGGVCKKLGQIERSYIEKWENLNKNRNNTRCLLDLEQIWGKRKKMVLWSARFFLISDFGKNPLDTLFCLFTKNKYFSRYFFRSRLPPLCKSQCQFELPINWNYSQRYVRVGPLRIVSILSGLIFIFISHKRWPKRGILIFS